MRSAMSNNYLVVYNHVHRPSGSVVEQARETKRFANAGGHQSVGEPSHPIRVWGIKAIQSECGGSQAIQSAAPAYGDENRGGWRGVCVDGGGVVVVVVVGGGADTSRGTSTHLHEAAAA